MTTDSCLVCFSKPASVTLHPCSHQQLCACCAVRLEQARCPTCRESVVRATFTGFHPPTRDFAALLEARGTRNRTEYQRTAQVLLLGPRDAEPLSEAFLNRLRKLFAHTPRNHCTPPCFGRHRQPEVEVGEEHHEHPTDELAGLPYESRFGGNAVVDGKRVRFSWIALPWCQEASSEWGLDILELRPDFLLLTASLFLRMSFAEMLGWDCRLRRMLGSHLPKRMWVFLVPSKKEQLGMTLVHAVEFNESIAKAWNSMPDLLKPLTFHVLEPESFMSRRLKRVVQRSAYHAFKERRMRVED